jgi:hypothetical protein
LSGIRTLRSDTDGSTSVETRFAALYDDEAIFVHGNRHGRRRDRWVGALQARSILVTASLPRPSRPPPSRPPPRLRPLGVVRRRLGRTPRCLSFLLVAPGQVKRGPEPCVDLQQLLGLDQEILVTPGEPAAEDPFSTSAQRSARSRSVARASHELGMDFTRTDR